MSSKKKAKKDDSSTGSDETVEQAGPRKVKPYMLAEGERGGKTVRVMTNDVRVWKTVE